jgi:hypothetical protein
VLAPRQGEAERRAVARIVDPPALPPLERSPPPAVVARIRVGRASGMQRLRVHRCGTVAQSLMAVGSLASRRQLAANAFALSTSMVMLAALPGVRSILLPPPPPMLVAQPSTSPYQLWMSVRSKSPESFYVVLESEFWANRRARIERHAAAGGSMHAELALRRLLRPLSRDEEEGTLWVERRRHFLTRDFAPGERVGRYFLSYLIRPRHNAFQ